MGEVFLAEDPRIDRRVAIKTVRLLDGPGMSRDDLRARLDREAKAAGRVLHPNVVTLFEASEADGIFFLVFEYVEGQDLAERLCSDPPLTLAEILRIGREAAAGLGAAHRQGIVHRDIKPSNLLLIERDGSLKISDFGIAKLGGQTAELTLSGHVLGTPHYLSPEQVDAATVLDGRSDLFSLGVVLYQLLSGHRPFESESLAGLIYQVVSREPEPLDTIRPDLPPRLCSAVMRLLAKDPEERFPSGEALADELRIIEDDLAAGVPSVSGISHPAARSSLREPVAAGPETDDTRKTPAPSLVTPGAKHSRRGLWLLGAIFAPALLALLLILFWGSWFDGGSTLPDDLTTTGQAAGQKAAEPPEVLAGTTLDPETTESTSQKQSDERFSGAEVGDGATHSEVVREVGTALTFRLIPAEAADGAVVKVDGIVRGPAAGSVITLSPGQRRIEIVALGFEPTTLLVMARSGASENELTLTMSRRGN